MAMRFPYHSAASYRLLVARFLRMARANLAGMSDLRAEVEFHHGLAQDFSFDHATVVFLFRPLGVRTLKDVMRLPQQSLERNPRRLRVI